MKKRIAILLCLQFFIPNLLASDYFRINYKIMENEAFAEILKKFVKDESIINNKSLLVVKTIKKNAQIKDWRNLKAGDELQLYIDPPHLDLNKYKQYEAVILEQIKLSSEKREKKAFAINQYLKCSFFYLASSGFFSQETKINPSTKIKFNQNSLITLGTSLVYYPKESLFSTSSGLYTSFFNDTSSNINSTNTTISPEIGFNIYEDFRLVKYGATIFSGFDYEKFSTFDLVSLNDTSKISIISNNLGYLTLGASKSFTVSNRILFSKISASQSIYSTRSNSTDTYKGNKILIYINYKINDKFFIHSLVKYHMMNGPDKLRALRLGIGVGYILF